MQLQNYINYYYPITTIMSPNGRAMMKLLNIDLRKEMKFQVSITDPYYRRSSQSYTSYITTRDMRGRRINSGSYPVHRVFNGEDKRKIQVTIDANMTGKLHKSIPRRSIYTYGIDYKTNRNRTIYGYTSYPMGFPCYMKSGTITGHLLNKMKLKKFIYPNPIPVITTFDGFSALKSGEWLRFHVYTYKATNYTKNQYITWNDHNEQPVVMFLPVVNQASSLIYQGLVNREQDFQLHLPSINKNAVGGNIYSGYTSRFEGHVVKGLPRYFQIRFS